MNIDFHVGEVVPGTHYRVVLRIGQGGMGSVYEVEHVELGKRFVLKALLPQFLERKDLVQRLRNEWRSLGKLEHANIVSVSDAGVAKNGVPFYVMERLQGETLAAALKARGRLSIGESVRIACEILEGLSAAHEIGVVHRDVKPPNIFLTQGGVAKVLDFGIAKLTDGASLELTGRGIAIGTPRYMSPEQAAGEPVDGRADVYAVGLLLFEMIAGVGPFDGGDANEVFLAHLTRVPPRLATVAPGVTAELDGLTAALLAKHPSERPATAGAAARALRGILRGYPQLRQDTFQSPMVGALTPVMPQAPVEPRQEPPRVVRGLGSATIFPPAPERVAFQPPARLGQRVPLGDIAPRRTPAPLAGYPADLTTQAVAGGGPHSAAVPSLSQLATFNDAPPTRTAVPVGSSSPPSSISRPPAWGSPSLPAPPLAATRTRLVALSALAAGVLVAGAYWLGRSPAPDTLALGPADDARAAAAVAVPDPQALPAAVNGAGVVTPPVAGPALEPNVGPSVESGEGAAAARAQRASGAKVRTSQNDKSSGAGSSSVGANERGKSNARSAEGAVSEGGSVNPTQAEAVESPTPENANAPPNRSASPSRGIENAGRRLPGPGIPLYRVQPRGR